MPLYPRLYSIASAILGNTSGDAADAVQETMAKIWRSGAAMATVGQPEAYAVTMLRNTAVDMLRKRRYDEPADEVREMASDPPPDPDTVDFLERIIDTLPPGQMEVIRLIRKQPSESQDSNPLLTSSILKTENVVNTPEIVEAISRIYAIISEDSAGASSVSSAVIESYEPDECTIVVQVF